MAGGIKRELVELRFSDVVPESVPLGNQEVIEDPRRAGSPLRCAEGACPGAAVGKPPGRGIDGGVVGDFDLDPTDPVRPARDRAELLRLEAQADKCAVGVAQLLVDQFGVGGELRRVDGLVGAVFGDPFDSQVNRDCLLYTSDAADE